MKKKNNFSLEDLLIAIFQLFEEMVIVLKERLPVTVISKETDYKDAADTKKELKVSDSTLYRWRKEGLINYKVNKGKIYYDILSVLRRK